MGEEAKQETSPTEEKKEEKAIGDEEKKEEKSQEEENKKEEPKPPSPLVLFVDLHCVGCAKKIQRSISKIRGVEGVAIDMAKNEVTIKGVVEPQALCNRITKKTKRSAKVLSPLPEAEGAPIPQVVASQVSGLSTVEINVNMHCLACAEQLKKKILKMKGVRTVETEVDSGKVTVTGTMDAGRLVDYVYRRTKKQAKIVPRPEPDPKPEPEKSPEGKEAEEKPAAEESNKKEEAEAPAADEEKKEDAPAEEPPAGEEKKEVDDGGGGEGVRGGAEENELLMLQKMTAAAMYNHQYYQPLYVIERIPAPQIFSDENPNACTVM